jgi:hypothetical protein
MLVRIYTTAFGAHKTDIFSGRTICLCVGPVSFEILGMDSADKDGKCGPIITRGVCRFTVRPRSMPVQCGKAP